MVEAKDKGLGGAGRFCGKRDNQGSDSKAKDKGLGGAGRFERGVPGREIIRSLESALTSK